jgi:hypothetical protein
MKSNMLAVSRLDARACSLDDDRFGEPRQLQDGSSLDRGACANADVRFAIRGESVERDLKCVRAGRQGRIPQLPFFVCRQRRRPTNQGWRAEPGTCARKGCRLLVFDADDESSR